MAAPDRVKELLKQSAVTGIDFVYVHKDQVTLDVHFLRPPETLGNPLIDPRTHVPDITTDQIRIYSPTWSERQPVVPVVNVTGVIRSSRYVLRLTTSEPGDFTLYRLRLDDPRIDPYFAYATPTKEWRPRGHNDVLFSFKAHCPSDLDCRLPEHVCPPELEIDFPVDYRARDFWSFRRALLDFASLRYPDWRDRWEADAAVMLAEVMSALGDDLAYYQDRIAREAHLETATQRRSLRHHARLVDYTVHDGLAATTWLDVTVRDGQAGELKAGDPVWGLSDDGQRIHYEVGYGLSDLTKQGKPRSYPVDAKCNSFEPHIWDEDDTCLPVGATELVIKGHQKALLTRTTPPHATEEGRWVLLKTTPENADRPHRRWKVRLIGEVEELADPLINDPVYGNRISRLAWDPAQALPFELDLTVLEVRANLVPATAGQTQGPCRFVVGDPMHATVPIAQQNASPRAIERQGPNGMTCHRFTLPDSDKKPLCWLGTKPWLARPEVRLVEVGSDAAASVGPETWSWRRSLLESPASQGTDCHFALEDGTWKRVVAYRSADGESVFQDYAASDGKTVRFGDGQFGMRPAEGSFFDVTYRLGNGPDGNVPSDTLNHFDSGALPFVEEITNPLPATDGAGAETAREVRQLAPDAFRSKTFRAVRPQDYAEAAERLSWVQRAGASFRWTGSWLTAFVTPDPRGAVSVTDDQRRQLTDQIDRFRQAGRDARIADPSYADIDLEITVCVEPSSFRGETKKAVLEALVGKRGVGAQRGFFAPDNFTLGTPLRRSAVEAAVQEVPGVRAVEKIRIRRRGHFDWRLFTRPYLPISDHHIVRLENDPGRPERGALKLIMRGGA